MSCKLFFWGMVFFFWFTVKKLLGNEFEMSFFQGQERLVTMKIFWCPIRRPSAAINATLAGVVEKAMTNQNVGKIYGAKNGIMGILTDKLIDLTETLADPETLQLLCQTPSSALGSCRMKLSDWEESTFEYDKILGIFRKYDIGYFVYIGGNDSMDTVHKLAGFCERMRIDDVKIIGAPKTIDNDLMETDHCPGFGSAAKYVAATMSEIACDCNVYAQPSITIVEIMGRDAGWLTASSALGRLNGDSAPDLIYLCERPFLVDRFLEDVREKMAEKHSIVIAVSEGLRNEEGDYVTDSLQNRAADAFGHKILAGAARYLEEILRFEIGCKVRSIELNVMQRCASHVASASDIYESRIDWRGGGRLCHQRRHQAKWPASVVPLCILTASALISWISGRLQTM